MHLGSRKKAHRKKAHRKKRTGKKRIRKRAHVEKSARGKKRRYSYNNRS